ncbi:MAG: AAA family ATPase [Deltaproteobacteria bacterium]|nr:AAA family ATPase [Deltaproteobacteria bacterium]
MIISHIKMKNWRNFRNVDTPLGRRMFLVGANASGKSNFLDALRFLRDIAKTEGGGLQRAVSERGGISKIRCLAARKEPQVEIEIHLAESHGDEVLTLIPDVEGTKVDLASSVKDVKILLDSGFSISEAVLPKTEPKNLTQLSLFNG